MTGYCVGSCHLVTLVTIREVWDDKTSSCGDDVVVASATRLARQCISSWCVRQGVALLQGPGNACFTNAFSPELQHSFSTGLWDLAEGLLLQQNTLSRRGS